MNSEEMNKLSRFNQHTHKLHVKKPIKLSFIHEVIRLFAEHANKSPNKYVYRVTEIGYGAQSVSN